MRVGPELRSAPVVSGLDRPLFAVAGDDGRRRFAMLVARRPRDLLEETQIVHGPSFKGKLSTESGWCSGGDQRRLGRKGPRAAERIEQGLGSVVSGEEQDTGGQGLGEGRGPTTWAIASMRQLLARAVEADRGDAVREMKMEPHIRLGSVHRRAPSLALPDGVDDRVLDPHLRAGHALPG